MQCWDCFFKVPIEKLAGRLGRWLKALHSVHHFDLGFIIKGGRHRTELIEAVSSRINLPCHRIGAAAQRFRSSLPISIAREVCKGNLRDISRTFRLVSCLIH